MFFILLALLCLGLLNWQLCLTVIAIVLIINNPVIFITLAACVAIPMFILFHTEEALEEYIVGDVVHIQRSDNVIEVCRIIAIDKTSSFPYNVESVKTGFAFYVTSDKIIQKEN